MASSPGTGMPYPSSDYSTQPRPVLWRGAACPAFGGVFFLMMPLLDLYWIIWPRAFGDHTLNDVQLYSECLAVIPDVRNADVILCLAFVPCAVLPHWELPSAASLRRFQRHLRPALEAVTPGISNFWYRTAATGYTSD